MFNENWTALALFALVLGLVLQQAGLLAFAVLLLVVIAAGWLWSRNALRGIEYHRTLSERRAFLGETVDIALQVANRKWWPVPWLKIDDEYPLRLTLLEEEFPSSVKPDTGLLRNVMSLRWFERTIWHHRVRCDHRGFYPLGPAHLKSGDLFGLFVSQQEQSKQDWLIVYPGVKPVEGLILPPKEPVGENKTRLSILEDPTQVRGIRDYQAQDTRRQIHWKATARRQRLQVRVYEPTTSFQVVFFLNMVTLPHPLQGTIPELLERAVNLAASLAYHAVQERFQVGLVVNGSWPQSDQPLKVLPSRSTDQLTRILEALAAVATLSTTSIEELLNRESARLPWGATLAVVTAVVSEELLVAMARLQAAGRRMVLFSLDDKPLPFLVRNLLVLRVTEQSTAFTMTREDAQ